MNNCLIDEIVYCLKDTQLSIEEAVKKAWYLNLSIDGIFPNEKELNSIQRKVFRDSRGVWCLTYKKSMDIYSDVDDLTDVAKGLLKSFLDLDYDYVYRYKFGIGLAHNFDYKIHINNPSNYSAQLLDTKRIFNALETDCIYEIRKLLE